MLKYTSALARVLLKTTKERTPLLPPKLRLPYSDRVVEHPMTGVIAKRLGSSWIDVLARLLLIATGVTDRTRT